MFDEINIPARRVGIMIGSDSDLPQCAKGLEYLKTAEQSGFIGVAVVLTNSIHRNTLSVLDNLMQYQESVDLWIIGAGAANHLTGVCDGYLRYGLRNDKIKIIGVAFENKNNPADTQAAVLSITQAPGSQIIFNNFVGEEGFLAACEYAAKGNFPEIKLRESKPVIQRSLDEATLVSRNKTKPDKIPASVKNNFIVKSLDAQLIHQGKVRDTYKIDDKTLLFVATDRISIFDFVLPAQIPHKGEVLTALTHFWLTQILDDLPHHLLMSPKYPHRNLAYEIAEQYPDIKLERSLAVCKTTIPPYEMIFRWHLGGSVFKEYQQTGIVAGQTLAPNLPKWSRLNRPLFSPSTKSEASHDENTTALKFFDQMGESGRKAVRMLELAYARAYAYALMRGILILDTKFEGLEMIADEVLTPDSSRFTIADDWQRAMQEGRDPIFYDKESIRQWGKTVLTPFTKNGRPIAGINNLDPTNPEHLNFVQSTAVPFDVLSEASNRYQKIFEQLAGTALKDYQQKYLL